MRLNAKTIKFFVLFLIVIYHLLCNNIITWDVFRYNCILLSHHFIFLECPFLHLMEIDEIFRPFEIEMQFSHNEKWNVLVIECEHFIRFIEGSIAAGYIHRH